MKGLEIERKFLLRPCSPKHFLHAMGLDYRKYRLQQYYLPEQNGEYIRYRRKNNLYLKTVKSGEGMVRSEHEYPVSKKEFESHIKEHIGKIIEKERFVFRYGGKIYEMDRFRASLEGLCYLEIEFDSREEAERFVLPEIFSHLVLAEVTEESRFNNSSLCSSTFIPSLERKPESSLRNRGDTGSQTAFGPFDSTVVAIEAILQNLAQRMEKSRKLLLKNEGDRAEALHQFRVSLRKARSILSLFKPLFLPHWYQLHTRNLSLLMAQTNAKRDIDVLLEKLPHYQSLLPKKLRKGVAPLRTLLYQKREEQGAWIVSLAHSELLKYEISTLARPHFSSASGVQPIVITAMQTVRRRIERIIAKGKKLHRHSGERAYHKLRIQFKKIRYFIEAMKPLIEREKYKKVLKIIKKMQVILGDFHDYQVQRSLLLSLEAHPFVQKKKTRRAIRKLTREIEKLEMAEEARFRKKIGKFSARKKDFKQLFETY